MNATDLPYRTLVLCRTGNSPRQGAHQLAHLLMTIGWPLRPLITLANLRLSVGTRRLAWACRAASGAGAPASRRWALARSKVSGLGALVLPPLWASPIATTAATATVPRTVNRRRRDMCRRVV